MCDRNIKNFDKYRRLLKYYAKALGLKIQYSDIDGEGSYLQSRSLIRLDPDNSESREIAVTLHELGHVLDPFLIDKSTSKKLDKAYTAVYANKQNRKQMSLVLECERRAWEHAKVIALRLKIRLGKWFYQIKNECLKDYTSN